MSMTPQILSGFETLTTSPTRVGSLRRVDAFVETNGGRVLEAFSTDAALAGVGVTVLVEIVLL